MKYHILYNPLADNGRGREHARTLERMYPEECLLTDVTESPDLPSLLGTIAREDAVILCGGDGTLNHFINDMRGQLLPENLFYYACGSGNDFLCDIGYPKDSAPVPLGKYLQNLPSVTVRGQNRLFLNGIGYGIDGYCCEEGDRQRARSSKAVNYTAIAIKGLLFHYKPCNAVITVDGVSRQYRKVWLAPCMHGRCYGGGMRPCPDQDRLSPDGELSVMVYYGKGKLISLAVFPSIFKGGHVKHHDMVEIRTGHDIRVEFDRPAPLQIDGETILNVTEYHALSGGKPC